MTDFKPSTAAIALLKEFEKGPNGDFAAEPYTCPAGKTTVGWGHVVRSDDRFTYPLTEERADGILRRDLERLAEQIQRVIRPSVLRSIKQCQIDALLCFAFNVGFGAFSSSTLLAKINQGDYLGAADQFPRWNKARDPKTGTMIELAGLTSRRKAERDLFLRDGVPT